jgi:hypothetical protein
MLTIIPWIFGVIFFFGYNSGYSGFLYKSKMIFSSLLERGVFRFRFLSTQTFLYLHEHIFAPLGQSGNLPFLLKNQLYIADDYSFYFTIFFYNSFFACIFCLLCFKVFSQKIYNFSKNTAFFLSIAFQFFFWIPQYVIVPYDIQEYCFFMLAVLIINKTNINLLSKNIAIAALTIIATLIRETSLFIVIYYACFSIANSGFNINKKTISAFAIGIIYLATYYALRLYFGSSYSFGWSNEGNIIDFIKYKDLPITRLFHIIENGDLKDIISLNFFAFSCFCLTKFKQNKYHLIFLGLSVPYIIFILYVGMLWEVRLWVPVLMGYLTFALIKNNQFESILKRGENV